MRLKNSALLALVLSATVVLTGCGGVNSIDAAQSMASSTDCVAVPAAITDAEKALSDAETSAKAAKPNTPAEAKASRNVEQARALIGALQKRANECSASAPQPTKQADGAQSLPSNGRKVGVLDPAGANSTAPRVNIPWVTELPVGTPSADTVEAGAPASMLGRHEILQGWDNLVNLVDKTKATWYVNEINARSGKTGISWSDIESWASARNKDGRLVEARVIEVFGHNISEDEARRRAAEIVGGTEVAARLPIVRHPREFMNTWTPDGKSMSDYLFSPTEPHAVRVSLAPLKLNDKGQAVGIYKDAQSGVFVDCYNLWWRPIAVNTTNGEPPAPPAPGGGTPPPPTPGGNTPPPVAPPTPGDGTPPPSVPEPKSISADSAPRGNSGNGWGKNTNSGPDALIPPQDMKQPDSRWSSPAPPAPQPAPVPEIPPAPAPAPEQGAPTPDNPAIGCIPAPGEDSC